MHEVTAMRISFDVDDTLAESFRPPTPEMLARVHSLMERIPFAIISAASFKRIERDFLTRLVDSPHVSNLYVLPNSSAKAYTWHPPTKAPPSGAVNI